MLSGFSFIRNGLSLGYPFQESLQSLLAICDEVVLAVGDSQDGTREYLESLVNPKLRIIDTVWDEALREGGKILAQQTDIALRECKGDWCLYLQGDEVLHEEDTKIILDQMSKADQDPQVEALLFRWIHLFGSYRHRGAGRQWYRREIRAFKRNPNVVSWGDAQGFRVKETSGAFRKLRARQTEARIFHYGWVRHPRHQYAKTQAMNKLYHDDSWMQKNIPSADEFQIQSYDIRPYDKSHPAIMHDRMQRDELWTSQFDPQKALKPKSFRVAISDWIEDKIGWRMGEYKNFEEC